MLRLAPMWWLAVPQALSQLQKERRLAPAQQTVRALALVRPPRRVL